MKIMLADQSRFEHEYIQHLANSYNSLFIGTELSSDDDDIQNQNQLKKVFINTTSYRRIQSSGKCSVLYAYGLF